MIKIAGKHTEAIVFIDDIEPLCLQQIQDMCDNEAFTNPIRIMPDTHYGSGSVIGFTMPLGNKLISNVIGKDVGCGILTVNIGKVKIDRVKLEKEIKSAIPLGSNTYKTSQVTDDELQWVFNQSFLDLQFFTAKYNCKFNTNFIPIIYDVEWLTHNLKKVGETMQHFLCSIGTMGSNNHYIEIGQDDRTSEIFVTVHSGSRYYGGKVCDYHQKVAVDNHVRSFGQITDLKKARAEIIEKYKYSNSADKKNIQTEIDALQKKVSSYKPTGLEYLTGQDMYNYCVDMIFAQNYAKLNRKKMIDIILKTNHLKGCLPLERIESIHNYIDFNTLMIRKGAIRSYVDEKMVIPFNMSVGMIICTGKGNPEWNFSAPHGAGRIKSRNQAKKDIDIDTYKQQMKNADVYSTSVSLETLDEAPDAYKSPILRVVKPIINIKDDTKKRY